jgi:hypothetical protein
MKICKRLLQEITVPAGSKQQHQAANCHIMAAQQLAERVQMGRAAGTTGWLGGLEGMLACLSMAG